LRGLEEKEAREAGKVEREVEVARVEKVARVSSAVCFDIIDDDMI
jgi:hypothetical protein